jgi:hypothetical protein
MFKYSYCISLLVLCSLCSAVSAKSHDRYCHEIFAPILKQEPLLQNELNDLNDMCESEVKGKNEKFWSCINSRLKKGVVNFERLILSSHLCAGEVRDFSDE